MDPILEDVTGYSAEDIDRLLADGNARFAELTAIETPTTEQVDEATALSAGLDRLEAEKTARATAAADNIARMSALRDSRVTASDEDDAAEADEEPAKDEEDDDDSAAATEASADDTSKEKKAVTASAPAVIKKRRPVVPETPAPRMTITAAADVPSYANGQDIPDADKLTDAFLKRTRSFRPLARPEMGEEQHYGLATMTKPFEDALVSKHEEGQDVLDYAGSEKRLPGGSLAASGGWCAPSEVLLDFCGGESTDGLWDLPEIQVNRGGVKTTPGPDFATLYSGSGFSQTEAQAIAATSKGCYEVPCPSFTDTRLDAVGLCIKSPILQNAAWPELTRRTIQLALVAQQHRVSAALLVKALAASTAGSTPGSVGGTASDTLNTLELYAETMRGVYRLPLAQTLEVAVPYWVRGAIRADLATRNGVDFLAVSDAMIDTYFAVRKVKVHWLYNFGTALAVGEEGYPASFTAMIYPSGTFVKGTSNVINLNAVYDAASLDVNMYTALFMEEGVLLLTRCFTPRKVVIALNQAGKTGVATNAATFTLS